MECSLSVTAWLTKQFLNDFRKMSSEGASPLCETQTMHESSLLSIQYLIQDLEIDQVIPEAMSVNILHSIGSSGMHPFVPGNMQRVSTPRQCMPRKKVGNEGGSLGNPAHDISSDLSSRESKARLDATLCLWRHRGKSLFHQSEELYQVDPPNISFYFLNSRCSTFRRHFLHFSFLLGVVHSLPQCDASY